MDLSSKELYHKAITQPFDLEDQVFEALLQKYPYSMPLRNALDKRKQHEMHYELQSKLFAPNVFWLKQSFQEPEIEELDLSGSQSDYVEYVEVEEVAIEETERHSKELPSVDAHGGQAAQAEDQNAGEEIPSLYDDELMPYSFRWWLYKTRMEHAETYQPFVDIRLPKPDKKEEFDFEKMDKLVLDQQIKQTILHYQSPEQKISIKEPVKAPYNNPSRGVKKTEEILERFIKEEPQIKPPQPDQINLENKARRSAKENDGLVTETLAQIYAEQGLYDKSIDIFKKLILKYPEKKLYFATQIRKLEERK